MADLSDLVAAYFAVAYRNSRRCEFLPATHDCAEHNHQEIMSTPFHTSTSPIQNSECLVLYKIPYTLCSLF